MSLKKNFFLFRTIWKTLESNERLLICRTIAITFIFNLLELLNIFLATSFAYIISGNSLYDSEKLKFVGEIFNLNESDFISQLKVIGLLFAFGSLIYSIFSIISLRDRILITARISIFYTNNLLENILKTYHNFFIGYKKEKLINSVLTEASAVTTSLLRPLLDQLNSILVITFLLFFWIYYDFKSALIVLVSCFFIYYLFTQILLKQLKNLGKKVLIQSEKLTRNIYKTSNMYREYLMSGLINNEIQTLKNLNRKFRTIEAKTAFLKVSSSILIQGLVISTTVLFLVLNQKGSIDPNQLAILAGFLYTVQKSLPLLQKILRASNTINAGFPAFQELQKKNILFKKNIEFFNNQNNESKTNNKKDSLILVQLKNIKITNLDNTSLFSYSFKKNSCTGIVGKSGCGKTTLLNLIAGLDNKKTGIFIKGENIKNLSKKELEAWRKEISYISQKPYLINGTLEENIIHLSTNRFKNKRLKEILEKPWMRDIVELFQNKNQSEKIIDDGGTNLSGGQVQRIAIARAMYQENPFLILDEVTSALDSKNESLLIEDFRNEKKNKCIIIVSHRSDPLKLCDDIIYLDRVT